MWTKIKKGLIIAGLITMLFIVSIPFLVLGGCLAIGTVGVASHPLRATVITGARVLEMIELDDHALVFIAVGGNMDDFP